MKTQLPKHAMIGAKALLHHKVSNRSTQDTDLLFKYSDLKKVVKYFKTEKYTLVFNDKHSHITALKGEEVYDLLFTTDADYHEVIDNAVDSVATLNDLVFVLGNSDKHQNLVDLCGLYKHSKKLPATKRYKRDYPQKMEHIQKHHNTGAIPTFTEKWDIDEIMRDLDE